MPLRFDIDYNEPGIAWDPLVDEVFSELTSSFLEMPKGEGFIDYPTFEKGYQALKRRSDSFAALTGGNVLAAVREVPISFIVFRCILGFSPPEWAYITTELSGLTIGWGAARSIDQRFRTNPLTPESVENGLTAKRIQAMMNTVVRTYSRVTEPFRPASSTGSRSPTPPWGC